MNHHEPCWNKIYKHLTNKKIEITYLLKKIMIYKFTAIKSEDSVSHSKTIL